VHNQNTVAAMTTRYPVKHLPRLRIKSLVVPRPAWQIDINNGQTMLH